MAAPWILQSKLVAPAAPAQFMVRPFFAEEPPAVVIAQAGPGYGKTLALLALSRRCADAGALTVWISLDEFDDDPVTFFHYLIGGVRQHIPQFGAELEALLMGERLDFRALFQRFFEAIAAYNLPGLALAIDDFHHLSEPQNELVKALGYFFDKLPSGLRLLIATRKRLTIPLARFEARGQLVLLDPDRLRFSAAEEKAFLTARAPDGRIPEVWSRQAAGLDGWPLGLTLASALSPERALDWNAAPRGARQISTYVAEELFSAQPDAMRETMLHAALLDELTIEACREVFGWSDAAERLMRLEGEHLLQRLDAGALYRFPTYLREFLSTEAARALAGLEGLHRQAARFYEANGRYEAALPHHVAAKDWPAAIAACDRAFPAMTLVGRHAQIGRSLDAFPVSIREQEPALQVWRAHYWAQIGRHAEAEALYEKSRALFAARGDRTGELKALVRLAKIRLFNQEVPAFEVLLERARALLDAGKGEDLADLNLLQALACEQRGAMDAMTAFNEAVLAIPIGENLEVAATHCIALINLFTSALHAGELTRARGAIAEALAIAETWRFYPYHVFASFLQAHLRLIEGDLEAAGAFLREPPTGFEAILDWHDLACAYTVLGAYHQAKGDFQEAEEALMRSLAIFERADFKEGTKVPLERLAWLAVQRRQFEQARSYEREAAGPDPSIYDLALALPIARACHLEGDANAALERLEGLIGALDRLGAKLHGARARLYLAATLRRLDRHEAAREAHAHALAGIGAGGYRFLLGQDAGLWEELAEFASDPSREATRQVPVAITPAEPAGNTACPRQGMLSFCCFGGFEVRLDGIVLDQWPRRKAKLILAALVLHPEGLRALELSELVGDGDAASTAFKVSLSALRRALEPQLERGELSRYVVLRDGRYQLNPDTLEPCDWRSFSQAIDAGRRAAEQQPAEAAAAYEQALACYRGNLYEDAYFQDFFEEERLDFQQRALSASFWLAEYHAQRGHESLALAALQRAMALAPCDQEVALRLMRLHQAHGRTELARQAYWDCRKALKSQLGSAPDTELESSYRALAAHDPFKPARR